MFGSNIMAAQAERVQVHACFVALFNTIYGAIVLASIRRAQARTPTCEHIGHQSMSSTSSHANMRAYIGHALAASIHGELATTSFSLASINPWTARTLATTLGLLRWTWRHIGLRMVIITLLRNVDLQLGVFLDRLCVCHEWDIDRVRGLHDRDTHILVHNGAIGFS